MLNDCDYIYQNILSPCVCRKLFVNAVFLQKKNLDFFYKTSACKDSEFYEKVESFFMQKVCDTYIYVHAIVIGCFILFHISVKDACERF